MSQWNIIEKYRLRNRELIQFCHKLVFALKSPQLQHFMYVIITGDGVRVHSWFDIYIAYLISKQYMPEKYNVL